MKRILVGMLVVVVLGPGAAQAYSWEDACARAMAAGGNSVPANTTCLYAIMADIVGPGPGMLW